MMANTATAADSPTAPLLAAVEQCRACADQVLAVLERERGLLEARDPEGLTALMPEKLEALAALERAEAQRAEAVQTLGHAPGPEGMRALLRSRADAALKAEWQALTDQLRQLQRTNEANGRMIHRGLSQTSEILSILTGGGANPGGTYSRSGAQHTGPASGISRSLGSA